MRQEDDGFDWRSTPDGVQRWLDVDAVEEEHSGVERCLDGGGQLRRLRLDGGAEARECAAVG
jgi:hypothetical protein